jgi:hypothetical protein
VRSGGPKEGVLVAWGFTEEGERVLLSVTLGMREAYYKRTGSLAEVAELLGDSKRVAADHYV